MPGNESSFSKESVRTNYDRMSSVYDFLSGGSERKIIDAAVEKLKDIPGQNILDIGCGTGEAVLMIGNNLSQEKRLFGVDLSFEMCRKALQKLKKRNQKNFLIVSADAQDLPFSRNDFDTIFFSFVLEIFPPTIIKNVIVDCFHLLKERGWLCVVNVAKKSWRNPVYGLYKWMNKILPTIFDCRPIRSSEFLKMNGFKIIEKEIYSMWGIPAAIILARKNR